MISLGRHDGPKPLLFLCAKGDQVVLEVAGQGLLAAVGGGDEVIQLAQAEEMGQETQSGVSGQVEDQVQCQQETAEEAITSGAFQESAEFGFEVRVLPLLLPVLQGGAWHAGLLGKLSPGGAGVVVVVEGMGSLGTSPTKGLWPCDGVRIKLTGSHGSWSLGVSSGKDTVGTRAWLVQGRKAKMGTA